PKLPHPEPCLRPAPTPLCQLRSHRARMQAIHQRILLPRRLQVLRRTPIPLPHNASTLPSPPPARLACASSPTVASFSTAACPPAKRAVSSRKPSLSSPPPTPTWCCWR